MDTDKIEGARAGERERERERERKLVDRASWRWQSAIYDELLAADVRAAVQPASYELLQFPLIVYN